MESATILTTCMGRLSFLRRTLPTWVEHTPANILVVDYCDPDLSGEHVSRYSYDHGLGHRLSACWYPPERASRDRGAAVFSKPMALNYGIERITTDYTILLDADTIVHDGFWARWSPEAARDGFVVVSPTVQHRSLSGLLTVPTQALRSIEGFDSSMLGWGCEDMDVRLRLALAAGLPYRLVDPVGVEALEHDDHLRVRYYREKDLVASNSANFERMVNNIMRSMGWTEQQLLQACEEREISQLMWARGRHEDT